MVKQELLIIDPQNDFCTRNFGYIPDVNDIRQANDVKQYIKNGALFVDGADEDMKRLAVMIDRIGDKLDDIHITLDSHHFIDIAHPIFWVGKDGKSPNPFTIITVNDLVNDVWKTKNPAFMPRATEYVRSLEKNGRYPLCIWPPHCLIGSWGASVAPSVYKAVSAWEEKYFGMVDYVTKGSNFWTEHYSAVQADVPDPQDPSTMLNTRLINTLKEADVIYIAGEALSHCVRTTITDISNNFGEENIKKFVLLADCTSNVNGFDNFGTDFVNEMTKRGMQVANSIDI